jgi:hypothetical protein
MDSNSQPPEEASFDLTCDYECESCSQKARCFLYAFERLGSKLASPPDWKVEDYERLVDHIKRNLERTIELVRSSAEEHLHARGLKVLPMESGQVAAMSAPGAEPEKILLLQLSRQFTERAYELLRAIRMRETMSLKLLVSLRELQWHHTLVTTKLCSAVAGLTRERGTGKGGITADAAREAKESLGKCRSALLGIVSILPNERNAITELLELSTRIAREIRIQLL